MHYQEVQKDLFSMDLSYHLAHCISADAKMGAGIAVQFRKHFDLTQLQKNANTGKYPVGSCQQVGRVLNLITKQYYWLKPSYETFQSAIEDMKRVCLEQGITRIAMPQIGAGIDRLKWEKNREIVKDVFQDTDIEIVVCLWK